MSGSPGPYDPTEEWRDDRPEQETPVEESNRAAADTESRVDEGGSDEFADDRTLYDPTDEWLGENTLFPETVGPYWMRIVNKPGEVVYRSNGIEVLFRPDEGEAFTFVDGDERDISPSTPPEFVDYLEAHDPTDIRDELADNANDADEWTDDRPQQATLVEESNRAAADTESRVDEGGSDEFADDRTLYDPTDDMGTQSSLTSETVGDGQQSLTGEEATKEPEWDGFEADESEEMPGFVGEWEKVIKGGQVTYEPPAGDIEVVQKRNENTIVVTTPGDSSGGWEEVDGSLPEWLMDNDPDDARDLLDAGGESDSPDPGTTETDDSPDSGASDSGGIDPEEQTPEEVAGYERIEVNPDGKVKYRGKNGGTGPATIARPYTTRLDIVNHGGRYDHRYTLQVRFTGDDGNFRQRNIASEKHTRTTEDNGRAENFERIVDRAVEWMRDNPAEMSSETTDESDSPAPETSDEDNSPDPDADRTATHDADAESDEDDSPDPETSDDSGGTEQRRAEKIEFGTLDAANEWRDDNEEHLHESDTRRTKTVSIQPDAPESVMSDAATQSTISTKQSKTYGQADLTDAERDRLDDRDGWTWGEHGFHAMSAKALLQEEGGTPWLDYYDHRLDVDEHLSVVESAEDMAVMEGTRGPGEGRDDSVKSDAEIANDLDRATGEACNHARDACEDGENEACRYLREDCDWSEEEIERLLSTTRAMGEEPAALYDPSDDLAGEDSGLSFEEWARNAAPEPPESGDIERPEPPREPSDEELRELAPTDPGEMRGETLRALKKAWTGYKLSRVDAREAYDKAEEYAGVINAIRVVNGQEPMSFEDLDGWDGGEPLPDDPTEEFPVGDGSSEKSITEAVEDGTASGLIQSTLGNIYDPTDDL